MSGGSGSGISSFNRSEMAGKMILLRQLLLTSLMLGSFVYVHKEALATEYA